MAINRNLSILAQGAGSNQTLTLTNAQANALTVGRQGTTNPVLNVDASTASVVTGLNLKGAAAAGGMALSVTSSGTNENLTIDAKGSGTITMNATGTGSVLVNRLLDISASTAGQIKFPATQNASTDANTLDDYEEGTWTPTITGSGGSAQTAYLAQQGTYTKIGRLVNASFFVRSNGSLSGPTGVAQIGGIPFSAGGSSGERAGGAAAFVSQNITYTSGGSTLGMYVDQGFSYFRLSSIGSNMAWYDVNVTDWGGSGFVMAMVPYIST